METVKVLLVGSSRLRDTLLSSVDGGRLDRGLRELVAEQYAGAASLEVDYVASGAISDFRSSFDSGQSGIVDASPAVLIFSVDAELDAPGSPNAVEQYQDDMLHTIRAIKGSPGSHIIVLNASTVDPSSLVSNYKTVEEPRSLRAHRYDLAVMKLSFEEGISIVDVDRIVAERGGAEHVSEFQAYSPTACEAIAAELIRVMVDYGFFDERPLLPQVGRQAG